jgi:leucyl aminopeptidase (aminopeptidase T)
LDGTIALDNADINPKKPVKVTMKGGYVDKIEGGEEAKMLLGVVKKGEQMARDKGQKDMERYARHIGELGIGLNPAAKMTGNMLEDEKLYKTVHIAIGANYDYDANALIHQDCLIKDPDLWVDGKRIMKKGNLLL